MALHRLGLSLPREALSLAVALFCIIAATNILTPLIPQVRSDFAVSISAAGVIVGAYGFARLAVDLPAGFLADRVGHRRLAILCLVLLCAASVIGYASPSVGVLILARVLGGMSVGILATIILSALSATARTENRGQVMSLYHVANNTGIALYPLVGGVVGAVWGWRLTFLVTALLSLVAGLILVPVLGRIHLAAEGRGPRPVTAADESRVLHGRRRLVAIGATNVGVVANFIHRHGFRNTILPLYAATVLGLGEVSIATAIALMSLSGLIVATPGGMLGDRIGRRRVITAGLAAVAAGDLAFLLTHDLLTFLVFAALIGFGDFFTSSQTALLSEIVPAEDRTKVLAGYRFSADLGALLGPVVLAAVMDAMGAQWAIATAAAVLLAASVAAWLLVPVREEGPVASRVAFADGTDNGPRDGRGVLTEVER
jgi:DHA1 family multidrug resistance protein-like MFS transporter